MYGVSGLVITGGGAGVTLAFTGSASLVLVAAAMAMLVGGLLLVRVAKLRRGRR